MDYQAIKKSRRAKIMTKTVVEFKIDNDFSKRVTERIEGKELP
jgi:hypothetical protein